MTLRRREVTRHEKRKFQISLGWAILINRLFRVKRGM
jgi:hypothetical protein